MYWFFALSSYLFIFLTVTLLYHILPHMSSALLEIREVVRCPRCHLNQFQTRNHLCRRCSTSLDPPPPKLVPPPPPKLARNRYPYLTLGHIVHDLRLKKGMNKGDLAISSHLIRQTIYRVEDNRLSPYYHTLIQLCCGLSVPIYDFFVCYESHWEPAPTPDIIQYFCLLDNSDRKIIIEKCNGYIQNQ